MIVEGSLLPSAQTRWLYQMNTLCVLFTQVEIEMGGSVLNCCRRRRFEWTPVWPSRPIPRRVYSRVVSRGGSITRLQRRSHYRDSSRHTVSHGLNRVENARRRSGGEFLIRRPKRYRCHGCNRRCLALCEVGVVFFRCQIETASSDTTRIPTVEKTLAFGPVG